MTGYKDKSNVPPKVAETPQLWVSRRKEELYLYQRKVNSLKAEADNQRDLLAKLSVEIKDKQAEFDALVTENNNKLQAIQAEIRIAGDDLVIDKAEFDERCKKAEAYIKERFSTIFKGAEKNRIEKERLQVITGEQGDKTNKLKALEESLTKRESDVEVCERSIKISLREADLLTERSKQDALDIKERIDQLNERSIRVDTKHTENANETIRIAKKTEELNALIKTQTVIKEEYDRIQKMASDAKKTMADFNSQRDWIAARNAELVTYERALRVKDSQIQEREGKVQQAEARISGG